MTDPFGIALLGCGTVGGDAAKARPIPTHLLSTLDAALADPRVHAVAEVVGGTGWAKQAVLAALGAGKHVVTANKALLSEHGPEVFAAARQHGRAVAFEASV